MWAAGVGWSRAPTNQLRKHSTKDGRMFLVKRLGYIASSGVHRRRVPAAPSSGRIKA